MNTTIAAYPQPWRRRGGMLTTILGLVLLVAAAAFTAAVLLTPAATATGISQPLGTATRAEVTISMGAGALNLSALPVGDTLLAGTLAHATHEEVVQSAAQHGETAEVALRTRARHPGWPSGWRQPVEALPWQLGLSAAIPLDLTVEVGVGEVQLDLTKLQVGRLDVAGGIGTTTLTLPRNGQVRAAITGGVGETTITIPAGVAARIEARTGLGPVTLIIDGRHERLPYVSAGYATAANRVDLTVASGVGAILVQANP